MEGALRSHFPAVGIITSALHSPLAGLLLDYKFNVNGNWSLDPSVEAFLDASGKYRNHRFMFLLHDVESANESATSVEGAVHEQPSEPAVRAEPTDHEVSGSNLTTSRAPKWLH